jgi:hypothetical protein
VRINTVPVEAYRQANEQTGVKQQATREKTDHGRAVKTEKIILPGFNDAEAGSVKVSASPSLLREVLSNDEKTALIRHFARFGDSAESSQIYNPSARVENGAMTGLKLDVTG